MRRFPREAATRDSLARQSNEGELPSYAITHTRYSAREYFGRAYTYTHTYAIFLLSIPPEFPFTKMKNYAVGFAQVATPGNSSPRDMKPACASVQPVGMILFIEE